MELLIGDRVQEALESTFGAALASSLPVERKFAETKRREAPRLCSVATASRNQLLRHFHRDRNRMLERIEATEGSLRKAMKTNVQSLAWKRRSALVSLGGRARGDQQQSALAPDSQRALQEAVEENRGDWEEEVRAARRGAADAAARAKVHIPLRESEWAEWMREHRTEFSALMRLAPADRRALCTRLTASPSRPAPAPRLGPVRSTGVGACARARWLELLWGRTGWFAVKVGTRVKTILVSYSRGSMWGIDLADLATPRGPRAFYLNDEGLGWISACVFGPFSFFFFVDESEKGRGVKRKRNKKRRNTTNHAHVYVPLSVLPRQIVCLLL